MFNKMNQREEVHKLQYTVNSKHASATSTMLWALKRLFRKLQATSRIRCPFFKPRLVFSFHSDRRLNKSERCNAAESYKQLPLFWTLWLSVSSKLSTLKKTCTNSPKLHWRHNICVGKFQLLEFIVWLCQHKLSLTEYNQFNILCEQAVRYNTKGVLLNQSWPEVVTLLIRVDLARTTATKL